MRITMNLRICLLCTLMMLQAACNNQNGHVPATNEMAASSASNSIAAQILKTETRDNILVSSKQAMLDISASDIAAVSMVSPPNNSFTPLPDFNASDANLPPLQAACEHYYQRADACFAQQGDDANALRHHNQLARIQAQRQTPTPDEATCIALNQSFDAVAQNLGCE